MSGIAGIYHLDQKPVDRALLQRMLHCIPHRGSDAVRIWTDGFVGLGHRQFCTTEESLREVQPARNRSGTCWVTFDGRVDNREELMDRLTPATGKMERPTDVELLLQSYDVWGVECLQWVIGDFAFALWDQKRQQLFCGRDTNGVRPFYYHFDGKTFRFSSECIQLFEDSAISRAIDVDKIAELFTWGGVQCHAYRDLTRTCFKGISELPSARWLVINRSGLQQGTYWGIGPGHEIRYGNKGEYGEHFRDLLRKAVHSRLRSSGPVGAELSGGFDSSSIVCMAQELYKSGTAGNQGFATFSMVFDELGCDERRRIKSVLAKYPCESHFVAADNLCGLKNVPGQTNGLFMLDSPLQPVLVEGLEALFELAHNQNIRVMLSGEGAEAYVTGSRFVLDSLIRHGEWKELWTRLGVEYSHSSFRRTAIQLLKYGLIPLLPQAISGRYFYRWTHRTLSTHNLPPWFTPSFTRRIQAQLGNQNVALQAFPKFRHWGHQLQYEGMNPSSWTTQPLAASPVERRFPYLDRRVIEFCLGVPPEAKYEHLCETRKGYIRGRMLQRHGLKGFLPNEVELLSAKVNFMDVYWRRFRQFKELFRKMFAPPAVPMTAQLGILDAERFWNVLRDSIRSIENSHEIPALVCLWINRMILLEIWLRALRSRDGHVSDSASGHTTRSTSGSAYPAN